VQSDRLPAGERKILAWAPRGLKTKFASSSAAETFSASLWPRGLQHVTPHTAGTHSNLHWGCAIFLDFGARMFFQNRWSDWKYVVYLTLVAQHVCGKCKVPQNSCCFVPFLKLHTKLSFVIFMAVTLQSYCDRLFWSVCLEILETKYIKGYDCPFQWCYDKSNCLQIHVLAQKGKAFLKLVTLLPSFHYSLGLTLAFATLFYQYSFA